MKVTFKDKSETREYPWIGISENGPTVLFLEPKIGIELHKLREGNKVYYSCGWVMSNFKTFEGEIVLSNS